MVGINIQDKDEPARRFLEQFGFTFPNAVDPGGKISVDYGVYGVPETFFIDRRAGSASEGGRGDGRGPSRAVERLLAEGVR